jgi:signal transduction histidine kinase
MNRRPIGDGDLPIMRDIISRLDSLADLIDDLMVFARPRPPQLATFHLRPLLADAMAVVSRDPAAASLQFTVEGPDLAMTADEGLIKATLVNLLLNSVQAMGGSGRIHVSVDQRDQQCLLHVRDSGPGITPELQERVFEPFFTTKARGGGLGLPVARRTAELHGGTLTLACPPEGGTIFTLTIPVRASQPTASDASPD